MKKESLIVLMACLLSIFGLTSGFAESLKLKTGETIEGKLVEKTNSHVKMDVSGIILTYFVDDIESTSWDTSKAAENTTGARNITSEKNSNGNTSSEEYYINDKAGIIAWHPRDWIVYDKTKNPYIFKTLIPQESKDKTFNYVCAFSPSKDKYNLDPLVMVVIQSVPNNLKDLSSDALADVLKDNMKRPPAAISIINLPYVVEIEGKKFVKQISIRTEKDKKQKIVKYSFTKGINLYTITCTADMKIFEANKKIFDSIVANLKTE